MTNSSPDATEFEILSSDLQVGFWTRLQVLRNEYLGEGLAQTVRDLDIVQLDAELASFVGQERLAALAFYSLRGEAWYPVPCLLQAKPILLGYYRLLYGLSQKRFYSQGPFGRFRTLEQDNRLTAATSLLLPALCQSLIATGWELFRGVQPVSPQAIRDLQLLTLGPQFRGGESNLIGQDATKVVFDLIGQLVRDYVESSTRQAILVKNASGRMVRIAFAADPDIAIIEALPTQSITTVSIEIKGGADVSNVHNRIGEAEKSHQNARAGGCTRFWTILKAQIDERAARQESPTTTDFFSLDEILSVGTPAHDRFRDLLYQSIGIG